MAVFRVQKEKNFTVMSNGHLRDRRVSLKAKGLLSLMLSLPEEWDYSVAGLAAICVEGVDAVRSAIWELEQAGYILRRRTQGGGGRFGRSEYVISEMPKFLEIPIGVPEKPLLENPLLENPRQINKDR